MSDRFDEEVEFIESHLTDSPDDDKLIGGGFRRGTVNIIGGYCRPKTTILWDHIIKNNIPYIYFDTERRLYDTRRIPEGD